MASQELSCQAYKARCDTTESSLLSAPPRAEHPSNERGIDRGPQLLSRPLPETINHPAMPVAAKLAVNYNGIGVEGAEDFAASTRLRDRLRTRVHSRASDIWRIASGPPRHLHTYAHKPRLREHRKILYAATSSRPPLVEYNNLKTMERSPQGYPQIAAFLDACDEFAMLRKFGRVRLRVLLNLQAEISHIESELDRLDREDDSSEMNFRLRSSEQCFDRHGQQKDLYRRLQSKLSEYDRQLRGFREWSKVGQVRHDNHKSLINFFWNEKPVVREDRDWVHHYDDLFPLIDVDYSNRVVVWIVETFKRIFASPKVYPSTSKT